MIKEILRHNIVSKIVLIILGIQLSSCSSTFEERAKTQMYKTLANEFEYADELEILNENVIYNTDSVFIMVFHMKGKKNNGDYAEGDMEYAYEEISLWGLGHPDVRVWDDYLRELSPFKKNSVEQYIEDIKELADKGYTSSFKTPYQIAYSILFSMKRKIQSEYWIKVDEYK